MKMIHTTPLLRASLFIVAIVSLMASCIEEPEKGLNIFNHDNLAENSSDWSNVDLKEVHQLPDAVVLNRAEINKILESGNDRVRFDLALKGNQALLKNDLVQSQNRSNAFNPQELASFGSLKSAAVNYDSYLEKKEAYLRGDAATHLIQPSFAYSKIQAFFELKEDISSSKKSHLFTIADQRLRSLSFPLGIFKDMYRNPRLAAVIIQPAVDKEENGRLTIVIVGIDALGKVILPSPSEADKGGGSAIYDFSTPCPPNCGGGGQ